MLSLSIKRKVAKEICTFLRTFNTQFLASQVAQRLKHLPAMRETWVRSLGQEDPLEKEWQSTPVILSGESHGQRSLVGYGPQGLKESDTTERLHFHFPSPQLLYPFIC